LDLVGSYAGGWAFLLLGCAILKTRSFSRILGWLFLFAGIGRILHTIPQLLVLGAIEGPLYFVAIFWIGIALLRQKQPQPAAKAMAAS
jgi:hypothetical protein